MVQQDRHNNFFLIGKMPFQKGAERLRVFMHRGGFCGHLRRVQLRQLHRSICRPLKLVQGLIKRVMVAFQHVQTAFQTVLAIFER